MFGLIWLFFIGLLSFRGFLASMVNTSHHTKWISLKIHQCMTQTTLINLNSNDYDQGLGYCLLAVNLDRCIRSCNTLNDQSNRVCVPNKTEDLSLNVFNDYNSNK